MAVFEAGYWSSGFVRLSYDPSNEVVIKLEDGEGRPLERGKLLTWQSNPKLAKPIELTSARQAVSFTEGHHRFVCTLREGRVPSSIPLMSVRSSWTRWSYAY